MPYVWEKTAPTLLLTRGVFGPDPWDKVDRSIELAFALGAPNVVLHPPFFWLASQRHLVENVLVPNPR